MRRAVLILAAVFLMLGVMACGPESASEGEGVCELDTDCEDGYICFNNTCVKGSWDGDDNGYQGGECDIAADCGDGYYCEDHFCYPIIEDNTDGDDTSDGDEGEGVIDGDDSDGDADFDIPAEIDAEEQTDGDMDELLEADIDPEPEIEPEPEPELEIPDIPRTQQCYQFTQYDNTLVDPAILSSCALVGTNCPPRTFQIQVPDNGGQGDVNMVYFDWTLASGLSTVEDKEIQIQAPGMSNLSVWNMYNEAELPLEFNDFWGGTSGIGTWTITIYDKGYSWGVNTVFNRACITLVDPAQTAGINWDSEQIACSTFASNNFSTCSVSNSPCTETGTLEIGDFAITNKYPEINLNVVFNGTAKLEDVEVRLYAPRHGEKIVLWEQSGDVTAIPQSVVSYELLDEWAKGTWEMVIEYAAITGTVTWNNFCVRVNEEEIPETDGDEELEAEIQ